MRSCFHRVLKIGVQGPAFEENFALVETKFGEKSRAISRLSSCYRLRILITLRRRF